MFQWFTNWRKRRQKRHDEERRSEKLAAAAEFLREAGYSVYGPDDTALFRYWDGEAVREADPFLTLRKLLAWQKEIGDETIAEAMAAREPAATIVVDGLCDMFAVKPWSPENPKGLTGWELLRIYRQFEALLDQLKKNGSPGPTSAEPTDSDASIPPEVPAEAPKPSSGSISTSDAPIPAEVG